MCPRLIGTGSGRSGREELFPSCVERRSVLAVFMFQIIFFFFLLKFSYLVPFFFRSFFFLYLLSLLCWLIDFIYVTRLRLCFLTRLLLRLAIRVWSTKPCERSVPI